MHSRNQIQLILFDLGNVLVELDGFPWFKHQNNKLKLDEIHQRWLALDSVRLFETGKIDEDCFFQQAFSELSLDKQDETIDSFSEKYRNWVINFYPGTRELLQELQSKFQIACLSNTNPYHIRHLKNVSNELDLFEHCFFSHEIGHIKPDPQAFWHVMKKLSIEPENILFLDDSRDNVLAAKQCGMQAAQVLGLEEVKQVLYQLMAI